MHDFRKTSLPLCLSQFRDFQRTYFSDANGGNVLCCYHFANCFWWSTQRKLSHSLDSLIGKRLETNLNGTMFPHVITEMLICFKRPQGMVVTYFVSELSEEGRKQEDSNKNVKDNILSCQQELVPWRHYSEQDENMKNMTAVFSTLFFFFWSGNITPRFLNGWDPSQIHRFWCTAWFFCLGIRTWLSCTANPFTFLCLFSPIAYFLP